MYKYVVGVRILGSNKIYYYYTNKHYNIGDQIKILAPNGGTPDAVIVDNDSRVIRSRMIELKEA